MAFHNVQLPVNIERGARGGPGFNTTVLTLSSGFEQRNINWSLPRLKWDLGYGIDSKADQQAVIAFFYARQGKGHSFRFKDWTDYEIGDDATDTLQAIATANGSDTQFQAIKTYTSGAVTFSRVVTRLVTGTPRVFLDGVEQMSGVSVNVETGVITFTGAPTLNQVVGLIAEFDVPVRFDTDELNLTAILEDTIGIPDISIMEVREELQTLNP